MDIGSPCLHPFCNFINSDEWLFWRILRLHQKLFQNLLKSQVVLGNTSMPPLHTRPNVNSCTSNFPRRGTPSWLAQWCALGAGTSRGTLSYVWHPTRLINEGGCGDMSMDTLHLKDPLVLFGFEGSALSLPLFLLSQRHYMLCHCSSTMARAPLWKNFMALNGLVRRCAFKPLFIHHSSMHVPFIFLPDSFVEQNGSRQEALRRMSLWWDQVWDQRGSIGDHP